MLIGEEKSKLGNIGESALSGTKIEEYKVPPSIKLGETASPVIMSITDYVFPAEYHDKINNSNFLS